MGFDLVLPKKIFYDTNSSPSQSSAIGEKTIPLGSDHGNFHPGSGGGHALRAGFYRAPDQRISRLLEKEGYLNAEDVWDELSYYAFNINEDAKPLLEKERRDDVAGWLSG